MDELNFLQFFNTLKIQSKDQALKALRERFDNPPLPHALTEKLARYVPIEVLETFANTFPERKKELTELIMGPSNKSNK